MKKIIILVAILCTFSLSLIIFKGTYVKNKENAEIENVTKALEDASKENSEKSEENITFQDGSIGLVIIPSLDVKAPIFEGISQEVLKYSVRSF